MAKHKATKEYYVIFDDGSEYKLDFGKTYYFHQQIHSYIVWAIEKLMKDRQITAKPVRVVEYFEISESEEYPIIFGM